MCVTGTSHLVLAVKVPVLVDTAPVTPGEELVWEGNPKAKAKAQPKKSEVTRRTDEAKKAMTVAGLERPRKKLRRLERPQFRTRDAPLGRGRLTSSKVGHRLRGEQPLASWDPSRDRTKKLSS